MAHQLAASDLVQEDSRRLVTDETELVNEELEHERELRRQGKQRQYDEDEEEGQPQDKDLLQAPSRPSPTRNESFDYLQTDSKQVKRTKRRRYWQRAAVNVLFILSWYFFSSIISVYSEFNAQLAVVWLIHAFDLKDKWMFSPEHYNFGYPLFVTTFHMLVQFTLSGLVLSLFPRFRPKVRPVMSEYL